MMPQWQRSSCCSNNMVTYVLYVVYLITGIAYSPLAMTIKYQGAAGMSFPPAGITVLCNTLGMASVGLLAAGVKRLFAALTANKAGGTAEGSSSTTTTASSALPVLDKRVLLAAAVDLASTLLSVSGLMLVGSGVYVIMYSSCTAWVAILSRALLGKRLPTLRWLGVALCTLGLVVNGWGSHALAAHHDKVLASNQTHTTAAISVWSDTTTTSATVSGSGSGSGLASRQYTQPASAWPPLDAPASSPSPQQRILQAVSHQPAPLPSLAHKRVKRETSRAAIVGGSGLVLVGALLHSSFFVLVERLGLDGVSMQALSTNLGIVESTALIFWLAALLASYGAGDVLMDQLRAHHTSLLYACGSCKWMHRAPENHAP